MTIVIQVHLGLGFHLKNVLKVHDYQLKTTQNIRFIVSNGPSSFLLSLPISLLIRDLRSSCVYVTASQRPIHPAFLSGSIQRVSRSSGDNVCFPKCV